METKTSTRNYYLDWLRVLAILFVFVYHSSRFFNQEDWFIKNPITFEWVEIWNGFASTWMMPLIFVISGASLYYAIGKGGAGKFVKDKMLRLLVPFLVCVLTHASLQVYLERLTHGDFSGSYFQFLSHSYYFQGAYEGGNPASGNFSWSGVHLWYLEWLFIFSLLSYPLFRWLKGSGRKVLDWLGILLAFPGGIYLIALPPALLLAFVDPKSPVMMDEGGWALLVYLWFLFSGFLLVSHQRLETSIQRHRWVSLVLALASLACMGYLMSRDGVPVFGSPLYGLFFGLRGFCSWCWILAIFGLAMKPLNFSNSFVRYANQAVLPFYILHQTVLLGVGYFVVQWAIPDLLRWLAILLISFPVIMVIYEYVVRRFNLFRFLFGMKPLPKTFVEQPREATSAPL